jgi:hypothetical protein
MGEPAPSELQQAEVAQKAMTKGFTLITHLHFSLFRKGEFFVNQAECLDVISAFLGVKP